MRDVTAFLRDGGRVVHEAQAPEAGEAIQAQSYLVYVEMKDTPETAHTPLCTGCSHIARAESRTLLP